MSGNGPRALRVRVVVDESNEGWILGKMARRLAENLPAWGVVADVAEEPVENADVNHWILYSQPWTSHFRDAGFFSGAWKAKYPKATMLITHIDDSIKMKMVKESIEKGVVGVGVCLSRMTLNELVSCGVPEERLCSIAPGHDGVLEPRRIVIGITSRVYPDGRKREEFVARLADRMPLEAFKFQIFGSGWERVCGKLTGAGATVEYDPGSADAVRDYQAILAAVPGFDYYLYTGLDEGSMGFMDAVAAGVRTIVPPVGFSVDIPGGLTDPFLSFEDLESIFRRIATARDERRSLSKEYSWSGYARRHALLWRALVADGPRAAVAEVARDCGASGSLTEVVSPRGEKGRRLKNIRRSTALEVFGKSIPYRLRGLASRYKSKVLKNESVKSE